jgi:hypothetical protein
LNTAVDIMKLIRDDTSTFQGVSKELLLECLETMEEDENPSAAVVPATKPQETPKKRRAQKPADPMDVKTLRRSTRLNKNLEGFKAAGVPDAEGSNAHQYVGHFDPEPPHPPVQGKSPGHWVSI